MQLLYQLFDVSDDELTNTAAPLIDRKTKMASELSHRHVLKMDTSGEAGIDQR
jgi:hypothetical protein